MTTSTYAFSSTGESEGEGAREDEGAVASSLVKAGSGSYSSSSSSSRSRALSCAAAAAGLRDAYAGCTGRIWVSFDPGERCRLPILSACIVGEGGGEYGSESRRILAGRDAMESRWWRFGTKDSVDARCNFAHLNKLPRQCNQQ